MHAVLQTARLYLVTPAIEPERLRAAIDQQFVGLDAPLGSAREVALFPPVTGG